METAETPRKNPPFYSITFTLVETRLGRKLFRLKQTNEVDTNGDHTYELHVEKGSASNPSNQFTRKVPQETAQKLKDAFDALDVFSWNEQYGDTIAPGSMRWSLTTVFKEDVFTVVSKGGSDTPVQFNDMLEELYRLDFPRPKSGSGSTTTLSAFGGGNTNGRTSAASLEISRAMRQAGLDLSSLPNGMGDALQDMLKGLSSADALDALGSMRQNPQEMQQRMKDEFQHMSPEEQNKLLDMLAQTGTASRAWWERFLRGL